MSIVRNIGTTEYYRRTQIIDGFVSLNQSLSVVCPGTRVCQATPGWRESIRVGSNATGPYSLDATTAEVLKPGDWSLTTLTKTGNPKTKNTELVSGFTTNLSIPGVISTDQGKANSIALTKIYSKIKSELEHMNSLASLAEFHDVVRQFGAPMAALVDLTNKRLNRLELERRGLSGSTAFKKAKWARIVASTWLEYAFGLAPLISDTRKAAEALARWNNDEEVTRIISRSKVRSRAESSAAQTSTTTTTVSSGKLAIRRTIVDSSSSRAQYVVGLNAVRTADFGSNERLLQLLGVTPENLVPAAWEAVPWSWLLDYFTNVGNILAAGATSTASVAWICKTLSEKHTSLVTESIDEATTRKNLDAVGKDILELTGGTATAKFVRTVVARSRVESLGVPPLYFEIPSQIGQLANMVAVLFARREKSSALWLF